jgi:peptidoglycan biosynthesis protein MviN/MurJ (putative lipid II flippase)
MLGQAVLNLAVSLAATWQLGLLGPLIGTAFVNVAFNPLILLLLKRDYGLSPRELVGAVVAPLLLAGVVLAGVFALRAAWPDYSWWRLAGEFVSAAAVYLLVAWFAVLSPAEKDHFRRLARRRSADGAETSFPTPA